MCHINHLHEPYLKHLQINKRKIVFYFEIHMIHYCKMEYDTEGLTYVSCKS